MGPRSMSAEWDKPSEALRRMADAPEPAIKAMTAAEKDATVRDAETRCGPHWNRNMPGQWCELEPCATRRRDAGIS